MNGESVPLPEKGRPLGTLAQARQRGEFLQVRLF
jgi:hypothetical protein